MKKHTVKILLKIVFVIFAACLAISAIAFNLEKLQISVIFFGIASVFTAIMVCLNKRLIEKNDTSVK